MSPDADYNKKEMEMEKQQLHQLQQQLSEDDKKAIIKEAQLLAYSLSLSLLPPSLPPPSLYPCFFSDLCDWTNSFWGLLERERDVKAPSFFVTSAFFLDILWSGSLSFLLWKAMAGMQYALTHYTHAHWSFTSSRTVRCKTQNRTLICSQRCMFPISVKRHLVIQFILCLLLLPLSPHQLS